MPRKRHVSRNWIDTPEFWWNAVMPRKRHVSRNYADPMDAIILLSHASQEACE